MRLPVHCCCEPARRLGWVEVHPLLARDGWISFLVHEPRPIDAPADLGVQAYSTISTEIAPLRVMLWPAILLDCGHYTIPLWANFRAVKSADQPIERWRRVVGFVERRPVDKRHG